MDDGDAPTSWSATKIACVCAADDQPPVVLPYLNTDAFVSGGITDNDPKILVKCFDDHGMNVSGVSLGHDLTAVLDGNVLETIILNDFYESAQDSSRKGQAIYPLRNLEVGRHTLRVKGWDIANNSGEGYTEFVVAEDGKAADPVGELADLQDRVERGQARHVIARAQARSAELMEAIFGWKIRWSRTRCCATSWPHLR